ncbi:hypothetical protein [Heyndrickxia acidicola]|uniref:Uncharacterized protein n=1 Tax=Heyndrickxia acidicola TaxID=209389 RepID=A0ABU6ML70_9BACI|nr:hypothetical protein [Heyndrickxia acidicola]MED1203790.1 hypothetical protein [Heyndrickxia acidicola]
MKQKENRNGKASVKNIKKRYMAAILIAVGIAGAVITNSFHAASNAQASSKPAVQDQSNLFNYFKSGASVSYTMPKKQRDTVKVSFYNDINTPVNIYVSVEKYNASKKKWEQYGQTAKALNLKEGDTPTDELKGFQTGNYQIRVKIKKSSRFIADQVINKFVIR